MEEVAFFHIAVVFASGGLEGLCVSVIPPWQKAFHSCPNVLQTNNAVPVSLNVSDKRKKKLL